MLRRLLFIFSLRKKVLLHVSHLIARARSRQRFDLVTALWLFTRKTNDMHENEVTEWLRKQEGSRMRVQTCLIFCLRLWCAYGKGYESAELGSFFRTVDCIHIEYTSSLTFLWVFICWWINFSSQMFVYCVHVCVFVFVSVVKSSETSSTILVVLSLSGKLVVDSLCYLPLSPPWSDIELHTVRISYYL